VLHQVAGYSTIAYSMIHAIVYIVAVSGTLVTIFVLSFFFLAFTPILTIKSSGPSPILFKNYSTPFRSLVSPLDLPC
jgi:hypothetical protein